MPRVAYPQATSYAESLAASTARIVELEAELRRAQAAHVALETEHETAAARVAHLHEVNAELEAEISEKSGDIQGLVAEMSQLTDECLAEERRLKEEAARARAEREKDAQAAQAEVRRTAVEIGKVVEGYQKRRKRKEGSTLLHEVADEEDKGSLFSI